MTDSIDPNSLNVNEGTLSEVPLHGKIDIENLVFRQIERCHIASSQDEQIFAANVRVLMNMVPRYKKQDVTDREDEYKSTAERWEWKHWCGVPLGTVEEPINGSPYLVSEDIIDWHQLLSVLLEIFEECGITWKFEEQLIETGKVKTEKPPPLPTPVFNKVSATQNEEEDESDKHVRIKTCDLCGERVAPGTGRIYKSPSGKKKLVHKVQCYAAAEAKWRESELPKELRE